MSYQHFVRQRLSPHALPSSVLVKWDETTLQEGFVPLPKRLLRCMDRIFQGGTAIEQLMAVLAIADYLRPNLTRGPSREFLAFISGLSLERLNTTLHVLSRNGLVTVQEKNADELSVSLDGLLSRIAALTQSDGDD